MTHGQWFPRERMRLSRVMFLCSQPEHSRYAVCKLSPSNIPPAGLVSTTVVGSRWCFVSRWIGGRFNRPIRRSQTTCPQAHRLGSRSRQLFDTLTGKNVIAYAHVGGRWADVHFAHDPNIETAMAIHSAWGTFEWLLHDVLEDGHRCGVVCNSDGRPIYVLGPQ